MPSAPVGSPLCPGDLIKDNDPRSNHRSAHQVLRIDGERAIASPYWGGRLYGRKTRVRLDRIHLDGQPRKSGWSRIHIRKTP